MLYPNRKRGRGEIVVAVEGEAERVRFRRSDSA